MVNLVFRAATATDMFTPELEKFDFFIGREDVHGARDTNDGLTLGTPWPLTALNDKSKQALYAGKTIGVLDGLYDLYDIFGNVPAKLSIAGGFSKTHTILKALRKMQPVIDWHSEKIYHSVAEWPAGRIERGRYVTIDGIRFTGANFSDMINEEKNSRLVVTNCSFAKYRGLTKAAERTKL